LLEVPSTKEEILKHIWKSLVSGLDLDEVLTGDREGLLQLFSDRYELSFRQDLVGLDPTGEKFNLMLNQKVSEWKLDLQYVACSLAAYWSLKHKGIVVVIDNTDQYNTELQDYCFTIAQNISTLISSVTIISMREERFRNSKIHGVLDAFQNSGYHVHSPAPHAVFRKRIEFSQQSLREELVNDELLDSQRSKIEDTIRFFDVLLREFGRSDSAIAFFFNACAHGNIRLALDIFSGFLTSGYTSADEMIAAGRYTISIHQVLKPVMVPERFFYDESKSEFPNIFKVRSLAKGSHFTCLRLLTWLDQAQCGGSGYLSITTIKDVFVDQYGMSEELELNLDHLLRYGMIESDNRLDAYSDRVDSVIVTPYGSYTLRQLSGNFAYLDLITLDCGVYDRTIANEIAVYGSEDLRSYKAGKKYDRVLKRLDKVDCFLRYLREEMRLEIEKYGVDPRFGDVLAPIEDSYQIDKNRVMRSARKNRSEADES
jgi:hypothetical protein